MAARSPFDPVAADYDAGRPAYPDGLYTALEEATGPLAGQSIAVVEIRIFRDGVR